MRCHNRWLHLAGLVAIFLLANAVRTQAQDPEQYLRDQYLGKTLVLRGFYSGNRLRYNASGASDQTAAGDWTEYGFVRVEELHSSNDRIVIQAARLAVDFIGKLFELRTLTAPKGKMKPAVLKIEADFPQHNPSPEQLEALMARIFLTDHDYFADFVPHYWRPCVRDGLAGCLEKCLFSPQILAVPGVAIADPSFGADPANADAPVSELGPLFRVGNGVSPPRAIHAPEPEFTESARRSKFKGTVVLGLVVNKEGVPTHIHILNPLGSGLDAEAVQAVQTWKFAPALKDGQPVAVEIAVEVDFHLY